MTNEPIKAGDIVTVDFENSASSNTYIVDSLQTLESINYALIKHPLAPNVLLRYKISELNLVHPNIKDSIERSLDFAKKNLEFLDYNTKADLSALCMYFVVTKTLTPRQKFTLSNVCGTVASFKFNNDIKKAINLVIQNEGVLDEFNTMWYRNFKGLFTGKQPITSKKQRAAIFNIAGFAMAELETPTVSK